METFIDKVSYNSAFWQITTFQIWFVILFVIMMIFGVIFSDIANGIVRMNGKFSRGYIGYVNFCVDNEVPDVEQLSPKKWYNVVRDQGYFQNQPFYIRRKEVI